MASNKQIQVFLDSIKPYYDDIVLIDRMKNRKAYLSLGLTSSDMLDIIKSLSVIDYYKGPEDDHDSSQAGCVWVFKKFFEGKLLYIKLKEPTTTTEGKVIVKCLSFHIDEWK